MNININGGTSFPSTGYRNSGTEGGFIFVFPSASTSPDWFQVYTQITSSLNYFNAQFIYPPIPGQMIYEYSASIGTVYSSSYFVNGSPILTIDPTFPNC